jgi:hypothetical protein
VRSLFEKGPPCAIGLALPDGRVSAIFCRYGGWLRDGGAADILSREYATKETAFSLLAGGHVVGFERKKKPVAVPYLNAGEPVSFSDDLEFRQHFAQYGVSFFLLWDGEKWLRSRPGMSAEFSAWCPVVGRTTKKRRREEPAP